MLNISTELKDLYKSTSIPKVYDIYFPALDLHINTEGKNDKIVHGSFELSESLCSEKDLTFGACEASVAKFTVADIEMDLKGQWFTIHQIVDGHDPVPFGVYKVYSCKKQDDLRFKDIEAYDALADTDVNVAGWYNSIFPIGNETYTLKQFRESLLDYLDIEYEDESLPNDDMIIEKTIEPTQLSGRDVLKRCVELNGAFGHINRYGKLKHIVLQPAYGLYPSETLYPSEDLYPVSEADTSYIDESIIGETVNKAMYQRVRFEEYTVKEIDKLIIRSEENDIGAIVGTGSNAYVIEGNFLLFGKSANELEQIAINAFGNMAKRPYRPYEAQSIGLPYIEVGDSLEFATDDTVVGYVLQRTLTGIQALRDEYTAKGNEEREQNFGVNKELIQTQGKLTRIKKDVEGVRVEVEDLAEDTASKFEQTSQQITAEVNRATTAEGQLSGRIDVQANRITQEVTRATTAEGELSGRIDVLAGQIVLKVDSNGNVAAVELDADAEDGTSITLTADNIELEGLVTANGNFRILEDGSIEAVNGRFNGELVAASGTFTGVLNGNNINSPNINGGDIVGAHFISYQPGMGTLDIEGAYIQGYDASGTLRLDIDTGGNITCRNIMCDTINGSSPINSGNLQSEATRLSLNVFYASNAGDASHATSADNLKYMVYASANGNFRPYDSGYRSCGTSEGLWSSVWAINDTILTSDEREKIDIELLENDERFLRFAKMIVPYSYKMLKGTSGRKHIGFIAQKIEDAMNKCGISSMEFAGLIKAPVYAKKLLDKDGNETDEYDTTSEIIDYSYHLRYGEHVPLIFLWMRDIEKRMAMLEENINKIL